MRKATRTVELSHTSHLKCFILTGRMQQRPSLFAFHSLLLTVMVAGAVPVAHAQGDVASVHLPDAPIPQQNVPDSPASTSTPPPSTQEQKEKGQPDSDEVLRKA